MQPPAAVRPARRPLLFLLPVLLAALAGCADNPVDGARIDIPWRESGWRLYPAPSPNGWALDRHPGAVIHVGMDPAETVSAYNPAPIRLANGDIVVYVKQDETGVIKAYRSTDGGRSFVLEGTALAHGPPGAFDHTKILDPVAIHDAATGTIHLWYKGSGEGPGANWRGEQRVGYATAHASDPTRFTRHPAPLLGPGTVESALGLEPGSIEDLGLSDVIRIGETWHFYGFYSLSHVDYRIFYATGPDPLTIQPQATVVTPAAGYDLAYEATVFRHPASPIYLMLFSEGANVAGSEIVHIRSAWSEDGRTWERFPGWTLLPDSSQVRLFAGSMLKENRPPYAAVDLAGGEGLFFHSFSPPPSGREVGWEATALARLSPWSRRMDRPAGPRLLVTRPPDPVYVSHAVLAHGVWTDVDWSETPIVLPSDLIHYAAAPHFPVAEITLRDPGDYAVEALVEFAGRAGGERGLRLVAEDGAVLAETRVPSAGGGRATVVSLSASVRVEGRLRVRLQAYQSSGADLQLFGGSHYPSMSLAWTRP